MSKEIWCACLGACLQSLMLTVTDGTYRSCLDLVSQRHGGYCKMFRAQPVGGAASSEAKACSSHFERISLYFTHAPVYSVPTRPLHIQTTLSEKHV